MKKSTNLQSKYNHPSENHFLGGSDTQKQKGPCRKEQTQPLRFLL